ncbi:MAG: hypothetical protein ABNH53_15245 [Henriciella sp.]|jgi:hypothetical protein
MHNEGRAFTLRPEDESPFTYSLMANEKADLKLYETGRRIRLTFFEEIKKMEEALELLWRVEIGHD